MVVESFSHRVVSSGVFNMYIATGFFATLIFFVLNSHIFTPLEMTLGTVAITILLKGVSNIMFSLIVLLFDLKKNNEEIEFKKSEEKLDLLVNEMRMKMATTEVSSVK
jgi:hypothetical protein